MHENTKPHIIVRGVRLVCRHIGYVTCDVVEFFCNLCGSIPSHRIRLFLYRRVFGIAIGKDSSLHFGCRFYNPRGVKIGDNCVIGHCCFLDGRMGLVIGNNVNLAGETAIYTLEHDPNSPTFEAVGGQVKLEDYVFTGSRALILPGVLIAKGAGIAAGAVVTKSVNEYDIVGGVPAKKIGERAKDLKYQLRYAKLLH